MPHVSRNDWIIGGALMTLLLALLAVALLRHAGSAHSAGTTTRPAIRPVATGSTSAPATGVPTSVATASPSTLMPTTTTAPATMPVPGPVSAVGDSILLDLQSELQSAIPGVKVDGLVSRQFETGIGIVEADRADGTLGNVLVVELGANGTVTSSDVDAMMQAASGVQRVVFVNVNVPRMWAAPDNAVLAAGVARYPGVAALADWNALSTGHPEWFTPDGVHLQPAGAQAMATLIARYA
jgi:hypothetical protein